LFERSCRVPLIVVAPGGARGKVCHSLVELVDIYPTVTDYCGLPAPHQLAGQSLRLLLQNPSDKGRDAAFTLVTRGRNYGQAVRTDRWRFIQWSDGNMELYDELKDPEETHDVSSARENGAVMTELKTLLKQRVGPYQPDDPAKVSQQRKGKKTS
jgi:arylsulfatase A-like enzyme